MTSRTHDAAAATLLIVAVLANPPQSITLSTVMVAFLANQIGGIAPDFDQPTAPIWRNLPAGKVFGKITDALLGGHRFLSHSLLGLALFGFLVDLLLHFLHPIMPHVNIGYVWWAFMIGMFSHLVMDTFTKEGVPWLLPIPFKFGFPPFKFLRITTGKRVELFVVFPALIALDAWLCAHNYNTITSYIYHHLAR